LAECLVRWPVCSLARHRAVPAEAAGASNKLRRYAHSDPQPMIPTPALPPNPIFAHHFISNPQHPCSQPYPPPPHLACLHPPHTQAWPRTRP
jgi:hypothetical protein